MSTGTEPRHLREVAPAGPSTEFEHELDRLSLLQALRDFEVANTRVTDLTQRLITAGDELVALRQEMESLRREHEELRSTHDQMCRSKAFKLASRIWALRNAL
jgi:hypothetical protein